MIGWVMIDTPMQAGNLTGQVVPVNLDPSPLIGLALVSRK